MISIVEKIYRDQARRGAGIFWSDETHSWMVIDPGLAASILRSNQFHVHNRIPFFKDIAEKNGIDIGRILDSLRDAPLSNNGERHRHARRRMAAALATRIEGAIDAFEKACRAAVAQALGAEGNADMFTQVLLPAMNAALVALGGKEVNAERFKIASPTQLFRSSQIFSGPRLAQLNTEISEAPANPSSPECPHLMTLFAGDPTLGSLGLSLVENLRSNPLTRLCDVAWSPELSRTSLPFAERASSCDLEVGGAHIRKGDSLSIYVGAFDADSSLQFGTGAHRCLGEQLAKRMWERLCSAMAGRREILEIVDVAYRGADFAFVMPIKIIVRVAG